MNVSGQALAVAVKKRPLLFICVLSSLALLVGIYYRSDARAKAEATLEQKTKEGSLLKTNIANATMLEEQLTALKAANNQVASRLVNPGDLALNLQYFYKIESETGTKLLDLRQSKQPDSTKGGAKNTSKAAYIGVPYIVSVEGEFNQIISFLRRLENGPRFSRLSNFSLVTNSPVGASVLTLSLNLELLGQP